MQSTAVTGDPLNPVKDVQKMASHELSKSVVCNLFLLLFLISNMVKFHVPAVAQLRESGSS